MVLAIFEQLQSCENRSWTNVTILSSVGRTDGHSDAG